MQRKKGLAKYALLDNLSQGRFALRACLVGVLSDINDDVHQLFNSCRWVSVCILLIDEAEKHQVGMNTDRLWE